MNTTADNVFTPLETEAERARVVALGSNEPDSRTQANDDSRRSVFRFIAELRRRRVCRAATIYSVGFWLVCQIVDVTAPAMGLPEWTLKLVIVLGLIMFPFALVLSWLIDITPDGLVADVGDSPLTGTRYTEGPASRVLDCALLAAATVIGGQLAMGLFAGEKVNAGSSIRRVAVEPFRILAVREADALSASLVVQLQHRLGRSERMLVVDSADAYLTADTQRLSGVVVPNDSSIHVTMTLIDNGTGNVAWSHAFYVPRERPNIDMAGLADKIANSLPLSRSMPAEEVYDAGS